MSPEREPMENDSNSRTAEELEQQTVDVYNSITKIAMLCGFGSSNYFKDLFRASTGRSPREYRKHSGLPIHPHLRDNG